MMTIDEAIAKRLEEKRLAREEAARKEKELQEAIAKSEREVAEQARRILSDCLEINFAGLKINSEFCHKSGFDGYYKITLWVDDENYIETNSNILATRLPELTIDPESLLSSDWRALHFDGPNARAVTDSDLLEMIIFAMYGSTSDYLSAMASPEEPGW